MNPAKLDGLPKAARRARRSREMGLLKGFHDKLRDECLNRELFGSLLEASVTLET